MNKKQQVSFCKAYCKQNMPEFDCVTGIHVSHEFPMHLHKNSLCVGIVSSGSRKMIFQDEQLSFKENDIFIINMNQPHAIEKSQFHDYIAVTIKGLINTPYFCNKITSKGCIDLFIPLVLAIKENIPDLHDYWNRFFEHLCKQHQSTRKNPPLNNRIIRALEFIEKKYQNTISIDAIATFTCLSPFHFCRLFKESTGLTPHNYLTQYRLNISYENLKKNNSVFDVAIGSGFYDSSHFIKTFQSNMAVSPKDYKDSITQ